MGTVIGRRERELVVRLFEQGLSMLNISEQSEVSYNSVKRLIKRYKSEGLLGLIPKYAHCGQKRSYESELSYRLVRLYKYYHPQWGVGYILMKLKARYPNLKLCVSRVYERRLKKEQPMACVKNPPLQYSYAIEASRLPHDTWQIDAKEQLRTLDGQAACYLTVSDEKTGCLLEANVFSLWLHESSTHRRGTFISLPIVWKMGTSQSHKNR